MEPADHKCDTTLLEWENIIKEPDWPGERYMQAFCRECGKQWFYREGNAVEGNQSG